MITKRLFGLLDGKQLFAYTIATAEANVQICTLGGTILSLNVPNAQGTLTDVALAMTSAQDMLNECEYMGAIVGRCANRIDFGRFTLNGKQYQLAQNDGTAHLHGGVDGFNSRIFEAKQLGDYALQLSCVSLSGDQGYPGTVQFSVTYQLDKSALSITYNALSVQDTVFNPTNHAYFNLNGQDDGCIYDNVLQIFATHYLTVDEHLIPCKKSSVKGTPFDFTVPKPIGQDIASSHAQIAIAGGYDHNYCVDENHVARAYSNKTGVQMDVYSDMPGVQFYTGNFLCGNKGKSVYPKHSGFCLETQFYPNAINRSDFESPVLRAGKHFTSQTVYAFSVIDGK